MGTIRPFKPRLRESREPQRKPIPIHESDQSQVNRIWLAVLLQATFDSCNSNPTIRKGVEDWRVTDDFNTVCELASLDPKQVSNMLDHVKQFGRPSINIGSIMSRKHNSRTITNENSLSD